MHIVTHFKAARGKDDKGIILYHTLVTSKDCIRSRKIWINQSMSFKIHAAAITWKVRQQSTQLWRVTKREGASPAALSHLATTATLSGLLWGSEIWWTGARYSNNQLAPEYNIMAPIITALPTWTPRRVFLAEAGLPPLNLLLDKASLKYGIRILLG